MACLYSSLTDDKQISHFSDPFHSPPPPHTHTWIQFKLFQFCLNGFCKEVLPEVVPSLLRLHSCAVPACKGHLKEKFGRLKQMQAISMIPLAPPTSSPHKASENHMGGHGRIVDTDGHKPAMFRFTCRFMPIPNSDARKRLSKRRSHVDYMTGEKKSKYKRHFSSAFS